MKRAVVGKLSNRWHWLHVCRGIEEPGGYLEVGSVAANGYTTQHMAFMAAWWHVKACRGKREFPER